MSTQYETGEGYVQYQAQVGPNGDILAVPGYASAGNILVPGGFPGGLSSPRLRLPVAQSISHKASRVSPRLPRPPTRRVTHPRTPRPSSITRRSGTPFDRVREWHDHAI